MKNGRTGVFLGLILVVAVFLSAPTGQFRLLLQNGAGLLAGRNVNMVSGQKLPWGDPFLQRQNEPSIAVSTRNSMHLLAGANDYRTVDMLIPYEELPGPPEGAASARDAWLGVYKSFDGGQSWISTLLPGFPQDATDAGLASPLKAFGTGADPVIRAGTNGLFYYAGLAFTRNQSNNSVFVARFIDNNNGEWPSYDPIQYLDTKVLETGNIAQFIDKPWLAVDIPRSGAKRVTIPSTPGQSVYAGNVYVAYSLFTGQDASNPYSKIMVQRSLDCGTTWEKASFISESSHLNQGAAIAIAPPTGYVYVAWRRFGHDTEGPAIMIARSVDGGKNFTKPQLVANILPFDQGTTSTSFRTNSYPAITVDEAGVVYVAWAQRGVDAAQTARILITTSGDGGLTWTGPWAVDNHGGLGHQFQPTLTYAAGKVTCVWYDQRNDASSSFETYISDDPGVHETRHTIDVRAAQAASSMTPDFGPSVQVSRYLHVLIGENNLQQVQFNPPNFPMFKEGTRPFHGDYIDVAASPAFVPTASSGWAYPTDGTRAVVFHAAWTDNRNVKPPNNNNWSNYTPPSSDQPDGYDTTVPCERGRTGMRNQDVYTASLTPGFVVGTPANVKPLDSTSSKHTFVVFVKNLTSTTKHFQLTIPAATGVTASFKQFSISTTLPVDVAPASSVSRTVFVTATDEYAPFRVEVREVDSQGQPLEPVGVVLLNPDIENPDIENPDIENNELHNPDIENPDIENPDIENVVVLNPDIENPDIENTEIVNPDIENPDIENPDIENPDIENQAWLNPDIENPDIENLDIVSGSISDYTWKVTNKGNTASAYTFRMISAGFQESSYPGFGFQLLIYKIHTTPAATSMAGACYLAQKHQDELIANIVGPGIIINPDIENPDIENPDIENPDIENATFWLGPGEQAYITLRVYDPDNDDSLVFDPVAEGVEGVTTGHAVNSVDEAAGKTTPPVDSQYTSLKIYTEYLPSFTVGTPYETYLVALGGKPHYAWSMAGAPAWLILDTATCKLSAQNPPAGGPYSITFTVTDSADPPNTASKTLTLASTGPCTVLTPNVPTGTATGGVNVAYTFTTGGATDSQGHQVEYRLEWAPGQYTSWSSSSAISLTFATTGTYQIRAQARCQTDNSVTSPWSAVKDVTIYTSVSTIQGHITYNGSPVTDKPDAVGKEEDLALTDTVANQRFPITPTYDSSTGFYSMPNIPQGTYALYARIDAASPYDWKHLPGDYDGITYNINVPAGPTTVTQNASVQKLLRLIAPRDNLSVLPYPPTVYEIFASPLLMNWEDLTEAVSYSYRVDKYQSDPWQFIEIVGAANVAASEVTLTLPASGLNDHYQFTLNAYNGAGGSGLLVGRLMIEWTGAYGWDFRFRIAPAGGAPEIDVKQAATSIPAGGSFDFGSRPEGSQTNIPFTIQNTGSGTLTIDADGRIDITGTDADQFRVDWIPNPTILAANSTDFKIVFSPTSGGLKTAQLSFRNNDANESYYNIVLQGTGVRGPGPEMNVLVGNAYVMSGQDYHFGSKPLDRATDMPFVIQNTGSSALTLTTPLTVNQSEANFTIVTQPSSTIPAGGSTILVVRFNPPTLGEKQATITIPDNDADEGSYVLSLKGTGTTGLCFSGFEGDTVGQPPQTGGTDQPTYLSASANVSVTVVADGGGIPSKGLRIYDSDVNGSGYVEYRFGPYDSGSITVEGTCSPNKLVSMFISWMSPSTSAVSMCNASINPRYEIYGLNPSGGMAGHYQPGRPFRFRIHVDMTARRWSIAIDNELNGFGDDQIQDNLPFSYDPSILPNISRVFVANLSSLSISGQAIVFDDIFIRRN